MLEPTLVDLCAMTEHSGRAAGSAQCAGVDGAVGSSSFADVDRLVAAVRRRRDRPATVAG